MRMWPLFFVVALMASLPAYSDASNTPKKTEEVKSDQKVSVIPLTNLLINNEKVWLPREIRAPKGKVKFVLNNTLPEPHGFIIPGISKEGIVVPANESMEVDVDLREAKKYELKCHMHPAHVSAFLETY